MFAAVIVALTPMAGAVAQGDGKVVVPEVWCDRNIPLPDAEGIYSMRILGWQFAPGDYDIEIRRPDFSKDTVLAARTDEEGSLLDQYAVEYSVSVPSMTGLYEVRVYPSGGGTSPLAVTEFYHNRFELVQGDEL